MIQSTSRYRRSVKFGILIVIAIKLKEKIKNLKFLSGGRSRGPWRRAKYGIKLLPVLGVYKREIRYTDWNCSKTKRKNSKSQKFCVGTDPGAPDAGRNMVQSTSRYYRSVKFGILIGTAVKLKGKIKKPKNSARRPWHRAKYGLKHFPVS